MVQSIKFPRTRTNDLPLIYYYFLMAIFFLLVLLAIFTPLLRINGNTTIRFGGVLFFRKHPELIFEQQFTKVLAIIFFFGLFLGISGFSKTLFVKSSVIPSIELQIIRQDRRRTGCLLQFFGGILSLFSIFLHLILLRALKISQFYCRLTLSFYLILALTIVVIITATINGLCLHHSIVTNEVLVRQRARQKAVKSFALTDAANVLRNSFTYFVKAALLFAILLGLFLSASVLYLTFSTAEKTLGESIFLKVAWPLFCTLAGVLSFFSLNSFQKTVLLQNTFYRRTPRLARFIELSTVRFMSILYKDLGRILLGALVGSSFVLTGFFMLIIVSFFGLQLPDWLFSYGGVIYRDFQLFWSFFYCFGIVILATFREALFILCLLLFVFGLSFAGSIAGKICGKKSTGLLSGILVAILVFIFYILLTQGYNFSDIEKPWQYVIFVAVILEMIVAPITAFFAGKKN